MITLRAETEIMAPVERCFDLARSVDLHAASACLIHGKAVAGRKTGLAGPGEWTAWSARFFGVRFTLSTQITNFEPPWRFSDVLRSGLFREFGHHYTFRSLDAARTLMTDDFFFQSPFGFIGAALDRFVLRRRMRTVADFRVAYIKRVAESDEWRGYLRRADPA